MTRLRLLALAALTLTLALTLGACSADSLSIRLLIADPPEPDPLQGVTTVRLTVSGEGLDARSTVAARDEGELRLPEVPYGNARVIVVEGLDSGGAVVSRGESSPFDLSEAGPNVVDVPFARTDCAMTFYRDDDRDGYGVDDSKVVRCVAPPDMATRGGDCDDGAGTVNPGQSSFADAASPGGGFDYNCDGKEEPELADQARCKKSGGVCGGDGWSGNVPACGASATFIVCQDGGNPCTEVSETRTQRCR
ncbi:MAG: hypothetical protein KC503_20125 [Myxococcales bacterium]|nr:hypothetical protein [Myxococcales bacterium]